MVKFFLLFFPCILSAEAPWGSEAPSSRKEYFASSSPLHFLILFHQHILSQADGPRSHFYPSSSEYTRQAVCLHGALLGFFLGCDRLLRENSEEWVYKKTRLKSGALLKSDPHP